MQRPCSKPPCWFLACQPQPPPPPPPPALGGKIQGELYKVYCQKESCDDLPKAIASKLVTTLGEDVSQNIRLPVDWFAKLSAVLPHVKQHVSTCLLKTCVGGWTTSFRRHEVDKLPCIFGCRGEQDTLAHYLLCTPLWQIAGSALGVGVQITISERLCMLAPSGDRVELLALCFQVYHFTKSRAKALGSAPSLGSNHVQRIAFEAARTFLNHIKR